MKATYIQKNIKPKKASAARITFGYISAFAACFFGLFMGWNLQNSKRKIYSTKEIVFYYDDETRKHGKIIFYISLIIFIYTFFGLIAKYSGWKWFPNFYWWR